MNGIGKIDRGRTLRQIDDLSLGRETEHLVGEHFQFRMFEEFVRIVGILQDVQKLAHPVITLPLGQGRALLVLPMRGDPEFGDLMHLGGADLHFDPVVLWPDQRRVKRLVPVGFRR